MSSPSSPLDQVRASGGHANDLNRWQEDIQNPHSDIRNQSLADLFLEAILGAPYQKIVEYQP